MNSTHRAREAVPTAIALDADFIESTAHNANNMVSILLTLLEGTIIGETHEEITKNRNCFYVTPQQREEIAFIANMAHDTVLALKNAVIDDIRSREPAKRMACYPVDKSNNGENQV